MDGSVVNGFLCPEDLSLYPYHRHKLALLACIPKARRTE